MANPRRIAAAVEDGVDGQGVLGKRVVNCEGETIGKQTVVPTEEDTMNSRVEMQGIDVGKERVEEVKTEA